MAAAGRRSAREGAGGGRRTDRESASWYVETTPRCGARREYGGMEGNNDAEENGQVQDTIYYGPIGRRMRPRTTVQEAS